MLTISADSVATAVGFFLSPACTAARKVGYSSGVDRFQWLTVLKLLKAGNVSGAGCSSACSVRLMKGTAMKAELVQFRFVTIYREAAVVVQPRLHNSFFFVLFMGLDVAIMVFDPLLWHYNDFLSLNPKMYIAQLKHL